MLGILACSRLEGSKVKGGLPEAPRGVPATQSAKLLCKLWLDHEGRLAEGPCLAQPPQLILSAPWGWSSALSPPGPEPSPKVAALLSHLSGHILSA